MRRAAQFSATLILLSILLLAAPTIQAQGLVLSRTTLYVGAGDDHVYGLHGQLAAGIVDGKLLLLDTSSGSAETLSFTEKLTALHTYTGGNTLYVAAQAETGSYIGYRGGETEIYRRLSASPHASLLVDEASGGATLVYTGPDGSLYIAMLGDKLQPTEAERIASGEPLPPVLDAYILVGDRVAIGFDEENRRIATVSLKTMILYEAAAPAPTYIGAAGDKDKAYIGIADPAQGMVYIATYTAGKGLEQTIYGLKTGVFTEARLLGAYRGIIYIGVSYREGGAGLIAYSPGGNAAEMHRLVARSIELGGITVAGDKLLLYGSASSRITYNGSTIISVVEDRMDVSKAPLQGPERADVVLEAAEPARETRGYMVNSTPSDMDPFIAELSIQQITGRLIITLYDYALTPLPARYTDAYIALGNETYSMDRDGKVVVTGLEPGTYSYTVWARPRGSDTYLFLGNDTVTYNGGLEQHRFVRKTPYLLNISVANEAITAVLVNPSHTPWSGVIRVERDGANVKNISYSFKDIGRQDIVLYIEKQGGNHSYSFTVYVEINKTLQPTHIAAINASITIGGGGGAGAQQPGETGGQTGQGGTSGGAQETGETGGQGQGTGGEQAGGQTGGEAGGAGTPVALIAGIAVAIIAVIAAIYFLVFRKK